MGAILIQTLYSNVQYLYKFNTTPCFVRGSNYVVQSCIKTILFLLSPPDYITLLETSSYI